jgi:hypothetical protein
MEGLLCFRTHIRSAQIREVLPVSGAKHGLRELGPEVFVILL